MTDPQRIAPARLMLGDCVEMMQQFDAASVDAVITDGPYGLEFMGSDWDAPWKHGFTKTGYTDGVARPERPNYGSTRNPVCRTCRKHQRGTNGCTCATLDFDERPADSNILFQEWTENWAREAYRVLKPGGHLLSFGSTRTYHRMASGIEDAGFELRDTIAWLYGSGFPKSRDVAKALVVDCPTGVACSGCRYCEDARLEVERWQGWGTALKPAFEPIAVARKPLSGTVAKTVREYGTGALNIDGCRIEATDSQLAQKYESVRNAGLRENSVYNKDSRLRSEGRVEPHEAGRWPANVLLDPDAADLLDAQTGDLAAGNHPAVRNVSSTFTANAHGETPNPFRTDAGGASRFFYVAKTSRAERNAGLEGFTPRALSWSSGDQSPGTFQSDGTDRTARNHHPTVKPIALMRWLCRLVTPTGGLILDPFLGSGTTGIAAALEGFEFAGTERDSDYMDIARARIAFWSEHGEDGLRICAEREAAERDRVERADAGQLDLFAAEA